MWTQIHKTDIWFHGFKPAMRNIFRIEHKHLVNPHNPTILDRLAKRRRIKIELWLTNQLTFSDVIQPGDIVPAVWCISVTASWWPVPPVWKDIWEYSHQFQDISLSIIWRCDCVLISCVCFIARYILISRWTPGGSPVNESRHTLQFSLVYRFHMFL